MMAKKYKSKQFIDQFDCYKGLKIEDWEAFNRGEVVELEEVPKEAQEFLEEVKSKSKESK
tara:strand:+ start:197 stop:376 length:180 start_codon:yes stop_codon:yes gene_type:complete